MSFSVISQKCLIFWWVSKNSLFWQLGPQNAHPQNTIKIGVSAHRFLKNSYASRNAHFWTKKPNPEIPVIIFLPIFFSCNSKEHKQLLKPLFYSVFANLKKEFSKYKLKTLKIEKPNFCTLFSKRAIFRKLQDNWAQKKHKMITEQKKIAWNHYFYSAKTNLAQITTLAWPR